MLRRLISAVFVIGLVLAFSGTATSDVVKGELNPVIKIDQNNERYTHIADARPEQPSFKKPESALKELPGAMTAPTTPQTYFCDIQDYTNGVPFYYWPQPDAYGDDLFNMRFTSDAGYDCTLKVGHYLMYGTEMVGAPDMRCYLWDDDGWGFPGVKLDSVDIPYTSLPTSGIAYVSADFTFDWYGNPVTWVFSDGDKYHLGWTTLDNSGAGTDVLAIISDDATGSSSLEERASEWWAPGSAWGTMLSDWGVDVSFFILAERCCGEIPYSDCYWQYYYTNAAYYWKAPHPTWGDEAYSMRMTVGGRETLQFVDAAIYDDGTGLCGNDNVIMTVYDDAGGLPGTQIGQSVIPAGGYVFFPAWQRFPFDLVLTPANNLTGNDFHIAFSSSAIPGGGDYECCLSSDGSDGVGRSASDWGGGYWVDMLTGWGLDCNFLFDAYLCKDLYYECAWDWCYAGIVYFWRLPDIYGDFAHAQKFPAPGKECQVMDVKWALYDNGDPDIYTYQSLCEVYTDAGGLPGVPINGGILIGPGTPFPYVMFPGWMLVDFEPLGIKVSGDYWVAITSLAPDEPHGIRTLSDDGGGGCVDGLAENWMGMWELLWPAWGLPWPDIAAVVEEKQCCQPYGGIDPCIPSEDWPTYQRDYARTGHSMNGIADAWCDLTTYWNYEDPAQGISWCGPIVAYDKVVQAFTDHYIVFELNPPSPPTASILYTISGFPLGGALRCTPTAAVDVDGDTVLYVGGGDQQSFACYHLNTGALKWSRDIGSVGVGGLFGLTRWGRTVILDNVLYWGTDDGNVVAAIANTGQLYTGWGDTTVAGNNPISLTWSVNVSGATDGTNLYYGTYIGTSGPEGDVYSINAITGVWNWQLSVPPAGGLQGVNVWTHAGGYPIANEGFAGGIMYDNGNVYTNSRAEADHPTDGLFYSLNANTGAVNYAVISNRAYYQTPIMDMNHVYMPTTTRWVGAPAGGNMIKFNKNSGAIQGLVSGPAGGRYYAHDAAATCEPEPEPDILIAVDDDGFLQFINTSDMSEIFRRKIDNGLGWPYDMGQGIAVAHDTLDNVHVLATCYWGNLIDLTKQDDRARLEIQTYMPMTAVEFGYNTALPVSIPDVFVNTGCIDLNFLSICVDTDPAACACDIQSPMLFASVSTVEADFMQRASRIADNLARDAYLSKYLRPSESVLDENLIISKDEMDLTKERTNSAATVWPPYLVSLDFPAVGLGILPGDTADLDMTVNQLLISRGPQCFYVQLVTNDPDFYPNKLNMDPCIYVCLVGGCLIDTTTLYFGMGCTDEQLVTNTGRLGNGDWGDGPAGHNGFLIDGDGASYYQGAYVYATSTYRIAVHTQDWTSGGGEADAFVSMQPDPNWCDAECKPHLMSGVTLLGCMGGVGGITHDGGQTYTPVVGDMVCKSFLDSVQNFGGDWENWGAPFDNDSTMGLYVESRVVGVCDVPELDNVTIEIMEFHNRNDDSVVGWYLGEIYDCDNGGDELGIDRDISTAWSYGGDQAWGQIKIPFGCVCVCQTAADNVPILNTWDEWGVSGSPGHGFWGWGIFWDSCYIKMSRGFGHFSDGDIHQGDEEAVVTFCSHDFGPYGDYEVAIAHFALFGLADASDGAEYAGMAHMVNKFCGWERGDVNNDGVVGNLCDIIYLAHFVNDEPAGSPGPIPFMHLGDVNIDGVIDMLDVDRLIDYYFGGGPCPDGAWCF